MKKNNSLLFESIPEDNIYNPQKNSARGHDKKVAFERSPMVVEYDKLSSDEEFTFRNNSSSFEETTPTKISSNFQLNWQPNTEGGGLEAVKHSNNPKPLPPMPNNMSESGSMENVTDTFNETQKIMMPKLRQKKPQADEEIEIDEKMHDLKISQDDFSIGDYINSSKLSINKFNFGAGVSSLKGTEKEPEPHLMGKLEDTLDAVLPIDRTPSTIIKENNQLYKKYRDKYRVQSNSSDKYYEDVILDNVRNNVTEAFSQNRLLVKRYGINKINEQENESSNGGESSKDGDFTIGDYMNSRRHEEGDTEPSSNSNHSIHKDLYTESQKDANAGPKISPTAFDSRVSSIGSSAPLGESTMVSKIEDSKFQDISLKPEIDEGEEFKPFGESVFSDQSNSEVIDQSAESNGSNFTLRLMQMKKEKEGSTYEPMDEDHREILETVQPPQGDHSLAPMRTSESILNQLIGKTNEYVAKSGIKVPAIEKVQLDNAEPKTKIFSNRHNFDKPNKVFNQPQFPRSPTTDSLSSTEEVHNIWASMKQNKSSTIRSTSMKSSPSMNSLEVKRLLQTKRKISNSKRNQPGGDKTVGDSSVDVSMSTNNHPNFINDTINRGDSDGDEEIFSDHIVLELSKVPQPLLPEQHFDNFSELEHELSEELTRVEEEVGGRTTNVRVNNNQLIVAKLEEKSKKKSLFVDEPPNEIFNSKKPHIYKGIVNKPRQKEIRTDLHGSHSRSNRKSSGGRSSTSSTSRGNFTGKDINVRKRNSGALRDQIESGGSSYHTANVFERQISAPKSYRISQVSKPPQSFRGSIHEASSFGSDNYDAYNRAGSGGYPEPILEDENHFDVNLPKDDQGRLYVRIVGLKNVDLPNIDSHNANFSLILDNGIHCILTPPVDLDKNTSINQEFELTVSENLEFIFTLKADYSYEGHEKLIEVTEKYPVRKRVLGGLFGHKTIYKTRQRLVSKIDKTDPWDTKTAKDGSFARAYVDFAQYEPLITGKACNFDVTCFNEWETYVENNQVKKRSPYRVGKLELQMLYIPRTKISEVFPPSIHTAYEAVKEYQKQLFVAYEGFLSQEGGDCNYLKRRWFTLNGTDLIAHNEFSKKTRAKINLIKAVGLISANVKKHYQSTAAGRRLSDEITMHQGFKVKFLNGEIIEFVADSHQEKMAWLKSLDQVISKNKFRQAWIKILYDQLT